MKKSDDPSRQTYLTGELDNLLYLGEFYPLVIFLDANSPIRVELKAGKAFFTLPNDQGELLRETKLAWYRWAAKILFTERAEFWAEKMQVSYQKITIRHQKTRWGSCSQKKNLSFNLRVIMAPLDIVDYITIHELAHLIEMNHSKEFWQIVKEFCPDYQKHREWLKQFGPQLII